LGAKLKTMENIINQLFEIEKKAAEQGLDTFDRNLRRVFHELEEMGYKIVNPLGTRYDERDASIEANILNAGSAKITKVLKPVIYKMDQDNLRLIQKGVVIVE
jgi:hypothetical protein